MNIKPLLLTFLAISTFSAVDTYAQDDPPPQIQVTGEAVLMKKADQLSLSVGVVTQAKNAEHAIQENAQKMSLVIDSLGDLGLTKDDYQTGSFSISPIYTTAPKNRPENWSPEILGYRVNNHLLITTDKTEMAGYLIDQVSQAGANSIDQFTFELKDPSMYREEAITQATQNAMKDAQTIAKASGVNLKKIRSISLQHMPIVPMYKNMLMMSSQRSYAPTQIESGDIEVRASVTVAYEIS